jgi:hypothetical protein
MDDLYEGAFQVARKLFNSEIWLTKPSSWLKIWLYIFGKVNHTNTSLFNRGENYFNFTKELKDIGPDITYDMVRHCIVYLKVRTMISTRKSTRGMIIKVLNFDKYQTLDNYKSTIKSTSTRTIRAQSEHNRSTMINKNVKNEKNEKKRYDAPTHERNLIPPTLEMVTKYCLERKNGIDPQHFMNSNEQKGWMIGVSKTKMVDWQAAIRTWEKQPWYQSKTSSDPIEQEIIALVAKCPEHAWMRFVANHDEDICLKYMHLFSQR